jgi:hypothetical protein
MTTAEMTPSLLRRTLLATALSAIGLAATGSAAAARSIAPALVDLRVVDRETGREARIWRHGGRLFVAGRPGARYSLRIRNNIAERLLVVVSVDGVNVITGETAGYDQKGYILRPYVSADISGWRKSDREVAAFTFAPQSRSYASRTGRPHDVGVIGVAAFTERRPAPLAVERSRRYEDRADLVEEEMAVTAQAPAVAPPPASVRSAPMPQSAPQSARRSERLGTGHGAREWSPISTVAFERASSQPQYVSRIEYDSYDNLVARGVIPRSHPRPDRPRPFPSTPDEGYVPDPPYGR